MEQNSKLDTLRIDGMTCVHCENKIEKKLNQTKGIQKVKVSYSKGTATITYNPAIISLEKIISSIEKLDYKVLNTKQTTKQDSDVPKVLGAIIIILAVYIIMRQFGLTNVFNAFPQAEEGTGYGMLFVIGLLTSVHCVAMCGGINLSQCMSQTTSKQDRFDSLRPSALYNLGRVLSYTIMGGLVGALGSVVSFSGSMKGIMQILAGIFMVIMGLNMLAIFPWLRRFNPRMPKIFSKKAQANKKGKGSLYVGLLNGLLPCGPLQAMQLYALSTGDPLKGAFSMFLFSLGTVPLMFGLGAFSSFVSRNFTNKVMKFGAVLVLVLGISMFNNGLALSGYTLELGPSSGSKSNVAQVEDGVQVVNTSLSSGTYEPITVQVGIPVKWTITAESGTINGCNNKIIINEYGIEKKLEIGENSIEFTPTRTGDFTYSCWMGMIRSTITVVEKEDISATSGNESSDEENATISQDPTLAGYTIPTDEIMVAEVIGDTQYVTITMKEDRFTPAVIVLQKNMQVTLNIEAESLNDGNSTLLIPLYNYQLRLLPNENQITLMPNEDFDFSAIDYSFYGYAKVVEDINSIDVEAIKQEVGNYQTKKWDYTNIGSGFGCH